MSAAHEIVVRMSAADARAITDRIKVGVEAVWELITQAYTERAWDALGYGSWDEYCTREFGTSRLRLPREERSEVIASLRESGLSTRAIAAATGINRETVRQEITSGDKKLPPAMPTVEEAFDHVLDAHGTALDELARHDEQELPPLPENYMNVPGAVTDSTPGQTDRVRDAITRARDTAAEKPAPKPVTGLDGKTYHPQPAAPKEPRRKPITDAFDAANYDLRRLVERVIRLTEDDRFQKNKDQIVGANLSDLIRVRDALNGVIQQLQG